MLVCLLSLLLDILYHWLLLNNNLIQILEELLQLQHGLLNLLNRIVALLDIAQSALRLTLAVGVEQSLLEDLHVAAVVCCLAHFGLGGLWVHDAVLSRLLLTRLFPEGGFEFLVVCDLCLDFLVKEVYLRLVHALAGRGFRFDAFHLAGEFAVCGHDFGAEGFDVAVGGVAGAEKVILHALELREFGVDGIDAGGDGAAFV